MRLALILAAGLLAGSAGFAHADQAAAPPIALTAPAGKLVDLDPANLRRLPPVEQDVSFMTSKGVSSGHYKGVLLWDVLMADGAVSSAGHNAELRQTFTVTGSDGYVIAFSIGEIAPEFGATRAMIAWEADGKALEGLRLVVPGDKRGARSVRDVVAIEMR